MKRMKLLVIASAFIMAFAVACNNKATTPTSNYSLEIEEGEGGSQFAGKVFKSGELRYVGDHYIAVKFVSDTQIQVEQKSMSEEATFANASVVTINGKGSIYTFSGTILKEYGTEKTGEIKLLADGSLTIKFTSGTSHEYTDDIVCYLVK